MLNILTITLNPSIDKSITVPGLVADCKLHCRIQDIEPGGGGINVSRAIKNLGGTSMCWFLEGGYHGDYLIQLVRQKNLDYKSFRILNETRENIILFDESARSQYLLDTVGPLVSRIEGLSILKAVKNVNDIDFIVASGSLPDGVPKDFYGRLAGIVKPKGIKLILDTSGEALELALKEGIYLFKPNLKEFCDLTGATPENFEDVQLKAKALIKSKFCEVVVISLGAQGGLLISKDCSEHIAAPIVKKESTVGAGDSMLAGIVYQLSLGSNLHTAVTYGVASGAAATVQVGTALCTKYNTDLFFAEMLRSKLSE